MNRKGAPPKREIFVFTAEEKKAAACVVAAFFLGLATMHYRAGHSQAVKLTPKQEYAQKRTTRAANARSRSARGQAAIAAAKIPSPPATESPDDDE